MSIKESNLSFELRTISARRISNSVWSVKLELCHYPPLQSPMLYVEFYDCEGRLIAAACLNDIEFKGLGVIEVEIPLQRPDRPCKARISLFSNDEELWTAEAGVEEHRY